MNTVYIINPTKFNHSSLVHTKYRCYCWFLFIVIAIVNKKMLLHMGVTTFHHQFIQK